MTITRSAYEKLIEEDVAWLKTMPRSSERDHIVEVLRWSVAAVYLTLPGEPPDVPKRVLYKLCRECGQPMKPKGVHKLPNEYDHAQGCRYARRPQP